MLGCGTLLRIMCQDLGVGATNDPTSCGKKGVSPQQQGSSDGTSGRGGILRGTGGGDAGCQPELSLGA